MSDQQTQALSLIAAYAFGAAHGLEQEVTAIREMTVEWESSYTSSLRRGYIVALFEEHGLFEEFKQQHWRSGNTRSGASRRARYLRIKAQYEEFLANNRTRSDQDAGIPTETDEAVEFALEAHLRDFLARNLDRVEPRLRLYTSSERNGIEFPVEGGRIDLLAVDRDSRYVVIELKLSQGRNKALGQLLYYMGWVDKHLGQGPSRGFIIASEITDELAIAVERAPGVSLARYRMNFAIDPVGRPTHSALPSS